MNFYDLSGLSVLVVDDNRLMREIVSETLQGLNVGQVYGAGDVKLALQRLRDEKPDLVFTDIEMAKGDGFKLIKDIRVDADVPDRLIPIIVLTANSQRQNIVAARDVGMTEFLAKPITAKTLYERILMVIESPRNFVKTKTYFGPDRRRKNDADEKEQGRRHDDVLV